MRFVTLNAKVGALRNQVLGHTSGAHCGVHTRLAKVAVFE